MYFTTRKSPQSNISNSKAWNSNWRCSIRSIRNVFGYSLEDLQNGAAELNGMVQAWRCADHDTLSAFLFEDFANTETDCFRAGYSCELQQRLFTERNLVMANGIEQFIRGGNGKYSWWWAQDTCG